MNHSTKPSYTNHRMHRRDWLRATGALALGCALPVAHAQQAASGSRASSHAPQPPRLITLGGDITEVVYLLGAQNLLVGTDTTSLYPAAAQQTPKVGYFRQLSAEGLLALKPSAVITSSEAGPPLALEQIRNAGVQVEIIRATRDWNEVRAKVAAVGRATRREAQAQALQARLDAQWRAALAEVAAWRGRKPRALFILAHGATPSVAAEDTKADALIRLIGCSNAMQGQRGYRPMTPEGLAQAAPDVLLTTTQGLEAQGGAERFWQRPGMALVPAYASRRLIALDALEMLGFGPRLPQTVRKLHQQAVRASAQA